MWRKMELQQIPAASIPWSVRIEKCRDNHLTFRILRRLLGSRTSLNLMMPLGIALESLLTISVWDTSLLESQ